MGGAAWRRQGVMCDRGSCVARVQGVHGRRDGHCSGQYASYCNVFLLNFNFPYSLFPQLHVNFHRTGFRLFCKEVCNVSYSLALSFSSNLVVVVVHLLHY